MKRNDDVKMSHKEFKALMREYSDMAIETGNGRLAAKCAAICISNVATGVTLGDDKKNLCYSDDNEYLSIARKCL